MKKNNKVGWRILVTLVALGFVAACSDGEMEELPKTNLDITAVGPSIVAFSANPDSIKAGEKTTLSWEVINADSIEIKAVAKDGGDSIDFNLKTEELKSSVPVENLKVTTDFTLTATKKKPTETTGEKEGEGTKARAEKIGTVPSVPADNSVISQTITVIVTGGVVGQEATITATPDSVVSGEPVKLEWHVPVANSTVVVKNESGDEIEKTFAGDDCKVTDLVLLEKKEGVSEPQVDGCAIVRPATTTTYTVEAITPDNVTMDASVEVTVEEVELSARIEITPSQVQSYPATVAVTWTVDPQVAQVTVSANPAPDAACATALAAATTGSGTANCTVSADTEFTISVRYNGQETSASARVTLAAQSGAKPDLQFVNQQWGFVGETVKLGIALPDELRRNPSLIQGLKINNETKEIADLKKEPFLISPSIVIGPTGVSVKLEYSDGQSKNYDVIQPVSLVSEATDKGIKAVTSIAIAPDFTRYMGVMADGFGDGIVKIYKNEASTLPNIDLFKTFQSTDPAGKTFNKEFYSTLATYPVIVALREENPNEVYVGTTGLLLRLKSGAWETLWWGSVLAGEVDQDPSHPTCGYDSSTTNKQKVQLGVAAKYVGKIISYKQVCDIVARKDGRVIIATDKGVRTEENIDDGTWKWLPERGSEDPTRDHVISALEMVGDNLLFAAADNGVLVSKSEGGKLGVVWEKFGDVPGPVFAIAYDGTSKIYAGSASGLYQSTIVGASWTKVEQLTAQAVTALVVDPYQIAQKSTIIAGTDSGLQISRDSGEMWNSIGLGDENKAINALAIMAKEDGANYVYGFAIGTESGKNFVAAGANGAKQFQIPKHH